jgi:hypothetical protein
MLPFKPVAQAAKNALARLVAIRLARSGKCISVRRVKQT